MARLCIVTVLLLSAAPAHATPPVDCVEVEAIVRYGAQGYDHWVSLESRCALPVRCEVASDVNPEPQRIELAPGASTELLTFRGSPARTFTPRVSCQAR